MTRNRHELLARRLKTTALAAGALLTGADAADAAVIHQNVDHTVNSGERFDLDLDGDGRDDFSFLAGVGFTSTTGTGTTGPDELALIVANSYATGTGTGTFGGTDSFGGAVVVDSGPFDTGTTDGTTEGTLSFGARVFQGSESVDPETIGSLAPFAPLSLSGVGAFVGGQPKFAGLVFNTTDYGVVTGWVRVAVPNNSTIYIQDYAFETDGGPIHVPNEVPEPSTLLLMASGAAGLLALRRRRNS